MSEWFGHRVYPLVSAEASSVNDQNRKRCPFLSAATQEHTLCIKSPTSSGICTISCSSNGPRQDWLVCPYRALDPTLIDDAVSRLFGVRRDGGLLAVAAPTLAKDSVRSEIRSAVQSGRPVVVYFQDKLGGEISLSATSRSPELSFDTTLVEIAWEDGAFKLDRYGILELQTMDFHGSYKHVVKNLEDGLRLHRDTFPEALQSNQHWLSQRIEGPNIANVFKRTFYQMMLKFQIGAHASCVGCVVAIPASVWDSWQRHLGGPELVERSDGTLTLTGPASSPGERHVPGWIYVFDTDLSSPRTPNPLRLLKVIATNAQSLAHYALRVAPDAALMEGASVDRLLLTIRRRVADWWPEVIVPSR